MKESMSLSRKLYLLIGAFMVGFGVFAAVTYLTVSKVKVDGDLDRHIGQKEDLIVDSAAPPLFVLRPYLLAQIMTNAPTMDAYQAAKGRFHATEKQFQERRDYWSTITLEGDLNEQLKASNKQAEEIFTIINDEIIAALDKGDRDAATKTLSAKLDPVFQAHRVAMDKIVDQAVKELNIDKAEVVSEVSQANWLLFAIGASCMIAVGCLGAWILRSVMVQNATHLENNAKLIAIGKASAVIEFEMDGTIITMNDNFTKAMGYTANELKGRHHSTLVTEAYRNSPEYREFWAKLSRGEYQQGEFSRIAKSGKEVWLQASYNPIADASGKYYKVVKFATDVTQAVKAREEMTRILHLVNENASTLGSSAEELTAVSTQMAANAEETSAQANVVSAASEQVSKNVQTVSTGVEEMNSAIREIAKNASEAARVAQQAVSTAESANATVSKLGDSSVEIGNVIKVITSIAEQTNLLALNATIEAARAGEAGKGFAVVANEVKELAKETARATEDIGRKVEAIQTDTRGAVDSIQQISQVINMIHDISNTIASAVEEQTATATEMSRNVNEAAKGTSEIAQNITAVAQAAQNTTQGASNSQQAASELARMAADLQKLGAGKNTSHSLAV